MTTPAPDSLMAIAEALFNSMDGSTHAVEGACPRCGKEDVLFGDANKREVRCAGITTWASYSDAARMFSLVSRGCNDPEPSCHVAPCGWSGPWVPPIVLPQDPYEDDFLCGGPHPEQIYPDPRPKYEIPTEYDSE